MPHPRKLDIDDLNEYTVLLNALEALSEDLDADDEDQPTIARLIEKLTVWNAEKVGVQA